MKIEHWVRWLCPGTFFPEESNRKIESRDFEKLVIPKDVYSFRFHDKKILEAIDEEGKTHDVVEHINESPRYILGKIYTAEEIKEMPDSDILYGNIKQYETECGVLTRMGNWQHLLEDDIVIDFDTNPFHFKIGDPVIYKNME